MTKEKVGVRFDGIVPGFYKVYVYNLFTGRKVLGTNVMRGQSHLFLQELKEKYDVDHDIYAE